MDALHLENVAALKKQYETRISTLKATISDLQRAMFAPPPQVPTTADVVNKHVQQQLYRLKNNVSTLATSGNTLTENADHVARHVSSFVK